MTTKIANTGFNPFEPLAAEVKQHIFSFLDAPSLAKVERVCKDWQSQTTNAWKTLYLRNWSWELPSSDEENIDLNIINFSINSF